jgi:hypothetical protein
MHIIVIDHNLSVPARKRAFQLAWSTAANRMMRLISIDIHTRKHFIENTHLPIACMKRNKTTQYRHIASLSSEWFPSRGAFLALAAPATSDVAEVPGANCTLDHKREEKRRALGRRCGMT